MSDDFARRMVAQRMMEGRAAKVVQLNRGNAALAPMEAAEPVASPPPEPAPKAEPQKAQPDETGIYLDVDEPWEVGRRFLVSRYWRDGCPTLRYWRGLLLRWTASHYAEIDEAEIKAELWQFLSTINRGKFKPQEKDVNGLLSAIKSRVILPADVDVGAWLGSEVAPWGDSQIIVCMNGVVRLSDGAVWSHDPKLFVLNAIETEYRPGSAAPRWDQFLGELWSDDKATRDALQEFFGLVLTDETRFQKGFILVGPARSGKGTIARMLRNLLGAKNYCGPSLNQLSQPFGLESFIGKKIAVVPDARTDGRTNRTAVTERLLSVIGEDPQDINRKNKGYWSGVLRTRVMILSNELPDFKDDTGVIATRFIILQMHTSFLGREDPDLEDKLRGEQSGILNWAVEGWQRLAARGKFLPPGNGELNDELAGIGSSIKAFVAERCDLGAEHRVEIGMLYSAYRDWCISNGVPYTDRLPSNHFSGKLRSAFPGRIDDTRPRVNNPSRKRMYVGIRLHRPGPMK
jgi:putative DNA primase/helicase